ncbi:protein Wnt-16-like [Ptychodera flava]|uniref:protein Wnt-16-like n=1 Tax=Ptychodera flava TaxID=63121 RepID=UPI00396AA4C0
MVPYSQGSFSRTVLSVLVLILLVTGKSFGSWLWLGVASVATISNPTEPEDRVCNDVPGLVNEQKDVCKSKPQTISSVSEGARLGIKECQKQFERERWNCSTTEEENVFGKIMDEGNRETAFIYAITSAGVVHAVTSACSAGNLTDCNCDTSKHGVPQEEGWKWGGCSDNINYGIGFSKKFVDAPDEKWKKKEVRNMMNLHNNEVGRKAIEKQMTVRCRCHGVSGSCNVKTCWKTMPHFSDVGDFLKAKYKQSVELHRRARKRLRRKDKRKRRLPINETEMVHMEKSPTYCMEDMQNGVAGTRGRECNRTSAGPGSCDSLCCGRGYNTQVVTYVERCDCKFFWCCYVKCDTCTTRIDMYTCK